MEPDNDNAVEGRIGLAVPTAVQAVPVGLAGGRRYRSYSAQRGESSLGVESFWIASSRDQ